MNTFYNRLIGDPDDFSPVADAVEYYTQQYDEAYEEAKLLVQKGKPIEQACRTLPGIVAYRYRQLQEIEQIMKFLENREKRLLGIKRRAYRETYHRDLNDATVERYAESDQELLMLAEVRNMLALVRNKFLGLSRQHEYMHFQLTNMTRLRAAGVEGGLL